MDFFLKKIFYFIMPFALISIVFDYYISEILKNAPSSGAEIEVWNDIYNKNIDVDIAIYGSSRAWVHIDPQQFENHFNVKAYNFGIDNQNFHIQYLRHKEYFKKNSHPRIVILAIDEHSLSVRKDLYNKNQFLPYMLWDLAIWEDTRGYNGFKDLDYFIPLLRYTGERENIMQAVRNNNQIKQRKNGYRGIEKSWNSDLEKAKSINPHYEIELDTNLIYLLEDFIEAMQKENINLIFVNTPHYIEGQNFVKNRCAILAKIDSLSIENKIPFLDYSDDIMCLEKECFYNSLHLNKEGSALFTKKFILDLERKDLL
jgi:hypothetical protein